MSTNTDTGFRFPIQRGSQIPILPRTSVFQTVKEDLSLPEIEEVMARPAWDFEEANLRLFKENKARKAAEEAAAREAEQQALLKPPPAAKKAASPKRKPTPKRPR